jgi:hypothetical protein
LDGLRWLSVSYVANVLLFNSAASVLVMKARMHN